jgi:hypothetical protein
VSLLALAVSAAACSSDPGDPGSARPTPATVVAVGDLACGSDPVANGDVCRYGDVASIAIDEDPDLFLALGDTQYETPDGTIDYRFYDGAFGPLRPITVPTPGDEDWTADRAAFLEYFGDRTNDLGYGETTIAGWQVIALNSQDCFDADGCRPGSAQIEWLRDRLADPPDEASTCTLAIWHDPRYLWAAWWAKDGAPRGPQEHVAPFWDVLDAAGADVVLNGNAHHYERWAPMDAAGVATSDGITEFVVGTGGKSLNPLGPEPRPAQLEVAQDGEFGVLTLDLRPGSLDYRWRGIDPASSFSDAGTIECR